MRLLDVCELVVAELSPNNSLERACSLPRRRAWPRAGMLAATRGQPAGRSIQSLGPTFVLSRILKGTLAVCAWCTAVGFLGFLMYTSDQASQKAIEFCREVKAGSTLESVSDSARVRGAGFRQLSQSEYLALFAGLSNYEAACELRVVAGRVKSSQIEVFKGGAPRPDP
jgi:hypothetical protein